MAWSSGRGSWRAPFFGVVAALPVLLLLALFIEAPAVLTPAVAFLAGLAVMALWVLRRWLMSCSAETCSFCGVDRGGVAALISGDDGMICDRCLPVAMANVRDAAGGALARPLLQSAVLNTLTDMHGHAP